MGEIVWWVGKNHVDRISFSVIGDYSIELGNFILKYHKATEIVIFSLYHRV